MSETGTTTEMPANVAALFASNPLAHTACVAMGHAYGKCKFSGTCPMTGLPMLIGTNYRHIEVWTRSGKHFSGTVAAKSAEFWGFHGDTDCSWTSWRRWHTDWLAEVGELEALEVGTTIAVAKNVGSYELVTTQWTLGNDGTWHGARYAKSSPKQLLAALRRTTAAVAFKVEPPFKPTRLFAAT